MVFANDVSKRVVFFAGPHKAASTSVEQWFYNYYTKPDSDQFALRYWKWPIIKGPLSDQLDESFKIFQELVKQPENAALKEEILVGIQEAFDASETGIILGTEDFDQVGHFATYDAVNSMTEILERLGVAKEDVTVILNYRSPRLDQWISVWKHDNDIPSYRAFMCDSQHDEILRKERIQALATQMDPLFAARTFLKEGWSVKVIDMGGVTKANLDIVNVIACDILEGKCLLDDEIVYGHRGDDTHFNVVDRDFEELTQDQREEAEKLFRARDCAFEDFIGNNPKFEIGYKDSIWHDCEGQDLDREEVYLYLDGNPEVLYSALLNQLGCSDDALTIEDALDGERLPNSTNPLYDPGNVVGDTTGEDSAEVSPSVDSTGDSPEVEDVNSGGGDYSLGVGESSGEYTTGVDETTRGGGITQASQSDGGVNFGLVVLLPFLLIAAVGCFFMTRIGRRRRKHNIANVNHNRGFREEFQDRRGLSVTEMSEVFTDDDWKMSMEDDDREDHLFSARGGNRNSLSLTI